MDSYSRGNLTFPVADTGPRDGPVVVLLHGFPQDAGAFDGVVGPLHEAGLRTLVPTQRGYAPTNTPTHRRDYRMIELAGDVLALLDAAEVEQAHVVGHDWGGSVAWAVAGWSPDRVHTLTALSTPHPAALFASFTHSTQALTSWYMGFFQLPAVPELAAGRTLVKNLRSSGLPADVAARYADKNLHGPLNWYRGLPFSRRPPVPDVSVPTTYVWGRQDFALKEWAADHTAEHVTGDYRFLPVDGGHWLPETRPDEVAAAVLQRIESSP